MILVSSFLLLAYVGAVSMVVYYWMRISNSNTETTNSIPVTVLVPVRNEEKGITATLESILSNANESLEIIVIDDHSTDNKVFH